MHFSGLSRWELVVIGVFVCATTGGVVSCHERGWNVSEKQDHTASVVQDADDSVDEPRATLDDLVSQVIADAMNERWKELGITDEIEIQFFADGDRLLKRQGSTKSAMSVCLIKPGSEVPQVRSISFGEAMKYTCVTVPVPAPLAVVNMIDVTGDDVSIQQMFLRYTAETGWRQVECDSKDRGAEGSR